MKKSLLAIVPSLACALAAQESKALLHAPIAVLPVDSPPFQAFGDFDGDGDLDALGTRVHSDGSQGEVIVWRNDSGAFTQVFQETQGFGLPVAGPLPDVTFAVATSDFDFDGRTDFVICSQDRVVRFMAQPNFGFTTDTFLLPTSQMGRQAVACGDFDDDGLPDIAAASIPTYGGGSELSVFLASGPVLTTAVLSMSDVAAELLVADLDGVGGADLLLFDRGVRSASYRVVGGQLQIHRNFYFTGSYSNIPVSWTAGDIDGDGDVDLVAFQESYLGTARYQVIRRALPAQYSVESVLDGGAAHMLVDIDGDGDLDGVRGTPLVYPAPGWPMLDFVSEFGTCINDGTGTFSMSTSFRGAGGERIAGAFDLDADGDVELISGRCVFYGNGPWGEQPSPPIRGSVVSLRSWNLHDLDRDGDLDFTSTFINNGRSFEYVGTSLTPVGDHRVQCDVDGDGARDLLQAHVDTTVWPWAFDEMHWHRNNGGGHFVPAGVVATPGLQLSINGDVDSTLVADFDGDGDDDVIFDGMFYRNDSGFFAGPGTPVNGSGLVVGDFDGDGLLDVVTRIDSTIYVLRNTGQPNAPFAVAYSSLAGDGVRGSAAVADFNDDGKLDFALPDELRRVQLFINATPPGGAPAFVRHVIDGLRLKDSESIITSPATIAAADFDDDGMTDLVIGPLDGEPGVCAVLRRVSWTTPPTLSDYEVTRIAAPDGYAADIDLDGDLDLAGGRLIYNRLIEGDDAGWRVQMHAGVAGENGAVPVLGASGPFRVGETEILRLTGVPGPTIALFGLSLGEANLPDVPMPGLTLYLDPALTVIGEIPITENGDGRAAAQATLPIELIFGLQGFRFYMQAFVFDAAAPQWFSQTNLMVKQIGS